MSRWTVCVRGSLALIALAACLLRAHIETMPRALAAPEEFRIATWNIRSGEGRCPIGAICPFTDSTQNCGATTAPMNAWGHGIPQAQLRALDQDSSVLAIGLQESWGCGAPDAVRRALGWDYASASFNGTALVARFGIAGVLQSHELSPAGQLQTFVLGADVCVDAPCTASVRAYVTHLQFSAPDDHLIDQVLQGYSRTMLAWIASEAHADKHVLIGDFNAFEREVEARVRCELAFDHQTPSIIRGAGYADAWIALHGTRLGLTATLNRNGCGLQNGGPFKRIDYGYVKGFTPITSALFGVVPINSPAPSDHYGLLTGFTGPTDPVDGASLSSSLIPLPSGEILLRAADDATPHMVGRWSIVANATANGGREWRNANWNEAKIAPPMPSPHSYFEVTFTAPARTPYQLWLRMHAQADSYSNDSVWVQFSDALNAAGAPAYRIGSGDGMPVILEERANAGVKGWGWADTGYGVAGTPIAFATSGTHTIRIQQREDGPGIDQILLSPRVYFHAAPGAVMSDTTWFRPTQVPQ